VPGVAEFFAGIVRDNGSREPGDFCYLARFHEWMEKYEEAEGVLIDAQALYPEYWEIPFQRAVFRVRARNYGGAFDFAEQATHLAPWKTQTWDLLAEVQDRLRIPGQGERDSGANVKTIPG
jgi:hypothetical protein